MLGILANSDTLNSIMTNFVTENINFDMDAVADFCRRWHVREFSLFGSVLRDDFTEDSDVDVMVDLEEGYALGRLRRQDAVAELSEIFGRTADIVTKHAVLWWQTLPSIRDSILESAEVVYENA